VNASVRRSTRRPIDCRKSSALRRSKIAQEWDYATPAERQETQDWNAEHGYCSHGIEFGCCPAGCDRDDDDWD
jgi:hypothetical protein